MDAVINQNARHEVVNCLRMLANCHAGIAIRPTKIEPTRIEMFHAGELALDGDATAPRLPWH